MCRASRHWRRRDEPFCWRSHTEATAANQYQQAEAYDASMPKGVSPATASANEVEKDIPVGNASLVRGDPNQLQPPVGGNAAGSAQPVPDASCGFDPHTGQAYRFNPETGQPCAVSSQDRVVVRQLGMLKPNLCPRPRNPRRRSAGLPPLISVSRKQCQLRLASVRAAQRDHSV